MSATRHWIGGRHELPARAVPMLDYGREPEGVPEPVSTNRLRSTNSPTSSRLLTELSPARPMTGVGVTVQAADATEGASSSATVVTREEEPDEWQLPQGHRWRPYSSLRTPSDRLLELVVPPEEPLADGDRGNPLDPPLDRLVGRRPKLVLHRLRLDSLQHRVRVELARGGRDQHVVHVAHVPAGREHLAEAGEREGDDPAGLLGVDRGADRVEGVVLDRPALRVDDLGQSPLVRPALDLGEVGAAVLLERPGTRAGRLQDVAEGDRLPLGLLDPGLGEEAADPLGRQVRVRRVEVVVEDRALGSRRLTGQGSAFPRPCSRRRPRAMITSTTAGLMKDTTTATA